MIKALALQEYLLFGFWTLVLALIVYAVYRMAQGKKDTISEKEKKKEKRNEYNPNFAQNLRMYLENVKHYVTEKETVDRNFTDLHFIAPKTDEYVSPAEDVESFFESRGYILLQNIKSKKMVVFTRNEVLKCIYQIIPREDGKYHEFYISIEADPENTQQYNNVIEHKFKIQVS